MGAYHIRGLIYRKEGGHLTCFFHCCVKNNDLYKCREGFLNILKNGEMTAPYRNLYCKIDFVSKIPIFSKPQRVGRGFQYNFIDKFRGFSRGGAKSKNSIFF